MQSVLYRYRANLGAHFVASSFDRGERDAVVKWGEKKREIIKRNIDSERDELNLLSLDISCTTDDYMGLNAKGYE